MSTDTNPHLRIAIIGGGIAGLLTVLSLHHHSANKIKTTIYERKPQFGDIGAGVAIGLNGAKLLHKLGLYEGAKAISGVRDRSFMSYRRYHDGEEVFTLPKMEEEGLSGVAVVRREFVEFLVEAVRERGAAGLETGRRCVGLEDIGKEVMIHFRDGSTASADLVIGADGIHSTVREQFMQQKACYSNAIAYRCLCDIDDIAPWWPLQDYATTWPGPKNDFFITFSIGRNSMGGSKILNVAVIVDIPADELSNEDRESWTLTASKDELLRAVEHYDGTVKKLIERSKGDCWKTLLFDRQALDRWVFAEGKLVLVGDAAHAMLPHSGAGASQAIEDGYVLGRVLQDFLNDPHNRSLETWLEVFQAARMPRAEKVQKASREMGLMLRLRHESMKDLSYEERFDVLKDHAFSALDWIWMESIDESYEKIRDERNG